MSTVSNKKIHIELMRVLACYAVIFNHTLEKGFFLYIERPVGSISFWCYLMISLLTKFNVPLFFAVSGALLLKKDEPIKDLFKKRVARCCAVLLLFSAAYYIYGRFYDEPGPFTAKDFLTLLYSDLVRAHLWYLYAYLAFLLMLPFLRPVARAFKKEEMKYLLIIAFIFKAVLPIGEYLVFKGSAGLNGNLKSIWLMDNIVLFPLIGFYLENRADLDRLVKKSVFLIAASAGGAIITAVMTWKKGVDNNYFSEAQSQGFYSCFTWLFCITLYVVIYGISRYKQVQKLNKPICSIGGACFGIYLVHIMILRSKPIEDFLALMLKAGINDMIACFIECLAVMVVSYILVLILKRLPVLKNLL